MSSTINFKVIESVLCNIATYDMSTSVIDAKIVVERNPTRGEKIFLIFRSG